MIDYSKFYPSNAESRFIRKLIFKKRLPLPDGMKILIDFDIVANDVEDSNGYSTLTGTVHISDGYYRWREYRRDYFFTSKLPVIISIIALVISAISLISEAMR